MSTLKKGFQRFWHFLRDEGGFAGEKEEQTPEDAEKEYEAAFDEIEEVEGTLDLKVKGEGSEDEPGEDPGEDPGEEPEPKEEPGETAEGSEEEPGEEEGKEEDPGDTPKTDPTMEKRLRDTQSWATQLAEEVKRLSEELAKRKEGEKPAETPESEEPEDLKELLEEFPEIKPVVDRMVKDRTALREEISALKGKSEEIERAKAFEIRSSYDSKVKEVHEDYDELLQDEGFWAWLENQSEGTKLKAGTMDPRDGIDVLNSYKASLASEEKDLKAKDKKAKEQEKLKAMQRPKSKKAEVPGASDEKDDPRAIWDMSDEAFEKMIGPA